VRQPAGGGDRTGSRAGADTIACCASTQLRWYPGSSAGATALATLSGRNESIITASSLVHVCPMLAS
jgi:hypothetical protein